MNDQEINITIAEACGWTKIREADYCESYINPYEGTVLQYWQGLSPSGDTEGIPDYFNDLNAMHEAEKALDGLHVKYFVFTLLRVVNAQTPGRIIAQLGCFAHIHATARQRAEAFLRTIGKWKEAEK